MGYGNFEVMLDSMQKTGVYVIREDDHTILYVNRAIRENMPHVKQGMVCREIWTGTCACCPLLHIGNKERSRSVSCDDLNGRTVDIEATRILWDETIPAFMITVTPHVEAANYTYQKIVRANLSTGTYEIEKISEKEFKDIQYPETLGEFFEQVLASGGIYPDDEEKFSNFTNLEFLRDELAAGKNLLTCTYRRKVGNGYHWNMLEIVPDYEYTNESQTVMLYGKDVQGAYQEGLESEEVNVRNQEIIKSLGEMNFCICVIDLRTGILNAIRLSEDVQHIVPEEGAMWDDVFYVLLEEKFHPEYKDELVGKYTLSALQKAWERGEKKVELIFQRLFGEEYRYVAMSAHFFENKFKGGYVVLALQDADERVRREIEQTKSDQRMVTVIKSRYSVMNTVWLDTGRCERVYFKETGDTIRILKGDYEYYINRAYAEHVYEEDKPKFWANLSLDSLRRRAKTIEDSEEVICQYRLKGRPLVWIEEHIFYIRQGNDIVVNILGRDITEKKKKEEDDSKFAKERAYIINCLSSMYFATYYINVEADTFRMVSQKQEVGDVLGDEVDYTEGLRTYAVNFVHPDDREEYLQKLSVQNLRETLSEEHPFVGVEYRRVENNGLSAGWIRANIVLAETEKGKPKTALYVAQDITETREKEEREHLLLKEACELANHANASKSEFLSRMSHDIRTPMNAIVGMTAIAGTHLEDKERVSDCLNKITVASKHLIALINEVLDMSKIESGKIDLAEEEFNLADMLQNIMTMIRPSVETKKHQLELRITKVEHEDVIGDMDRLQQVFMNLLGNAVKYTPAGGKLELEISEKVSKIYGYGCYEFVFRDNGIGMDEEFQKKIFEPFSRAEDSRISKIEGTGLGMAIVHNIVHMMNGNICVESKIGEGSKFTVTIFLKQQNTKLPDMEQFADLPVLVADDDEGACEATCAVLEDIGMRGEWVLCGKDAVERVSEAHERQEDFFAVILDWKMPDMDGIETARNIRKKVGPSVPIVILSAYDWTILEEEAREAGVNGFISKPLFKSRLIYMFKRLSGDDNRVEAAQQESVSETSFENKRILLAEDNELNREIAEELIGSMGVMIESVNNGEEAVARFTEMGEGYYDLIFMDIQMPVMNGYEAAQTIRNIERPDAASIPIIAMTANAFADDIMASKNAGMNEHITKPLSISRLAECMELWLK